MVITEPNPAAIAAIITSFIVITPVSTGHCDIY
jgi:hypothetical protein